MADDVNNTLFRVVPTSTFGLVVQSETRPSIDESDFARIRKRQDSLQFALIPVSLVVRKPPFLVRAETRLDSAADRAARPARAVTVALAPFQTTQDFFRTLQTHFTPFDKTFFDRQCREAPLEPPLWSESNGRNDSLEKESAKKVIFAPPSRNTGYPSPRCLKRFPDTSQTNALANYRTVAMVSYDQ